MLICELLLVKIQEEKQNIRQDFRGETSVLSYYNS